MAAKRAPRIKKRLPCDVRVTGRQHSGMVLNLSPRGLFVQTHASVGPGDAVDVSLRVPAFGEPISLRTRVVWRRVVPQQLRNVAEGGFGVQIENASEDYYRYLTSILSARS